MAQKVRINGTAYDLKPSPCLINGTKYQIRGGRTLINGTGYDISLKSGTPLSEIPVGNTVKIAVNGTMRDWLVVNQGTPSNIYDDSCNGTWLLMKDIYSNVIWQGDGKILNAYESSNVNTLLNSDFLNLIDANVRKSIKQVKIPYQAKGGINGHVMSGSSGLSCKAFLLSGFEVGASSDDGGVFPYLPRDGGKLSYFTRGADAAAANVRIAKLNGTDASWWLRSPYRENSALVWLVNLKGYVGYGGVSTTGKLEPMGCRPAIILPFETLVADDGTVLA